MKEEKLEQLREIFKTKVKGMINLLESPGFFTKGETKDYINDMANELVYEVKIRINNK